MKTDGLIHLQAFGEKKKKIWANSAATMASEDEIQQPLDWANNCASIVDCWKFSRAEGLRYGFGLGFYCGHSDMLRSILTTVVSTAAEVTVVQPFSMGCSIKMSASLVFLNSLFNAFGVRKRRKKPMVLNIEKEEEKEHTQYLNDKIHSNAITRKKQKQKQPWYDTYSL